MISIYVIRNKANNKVYIGQTVQTLNNRLNGHLQDSRYGSQMAVHCALRKYGPGLFEIVALCTAEDQDQANRLEKAFILATRANKGRGYNMTDGGNPMALLLRFSGVA
jgi:group I intron endonuclease